jgi:hypothetical protein
MPVYSRAKSISASGATSITATFDETTAPSSTSSLVAILHASTLPATVTGNSWGVSALGGSGNNGSLNYLAAYIIRGDGARNSVTFNFSQSVSNSKVDLYAFDGFVSLTPDVSSGSSTSGVTSLTISNSDPLSKSKTISIAAISLSGGSGGFGSFANGYERLDSTYTIMTSGTRAYTAAGVVPTTSISWPTSRNARSAIWNIEGVSAGTSTTPPVTENPGTSNPSTGSAPKFALGGTTLKAYLGTTLLSGTTTTPNPDPDPEPEPEPEVPVETPINADGLTQAIMPSYSKAWTLAPAPTITWQSSASLTGSLILPTDARLKYTGHASTGTSKTPRGIVAAATSGYWRPRYMANSSTAGTGTDPNFLAMYGIRIRTNSPIIEVKLQQRPDLSGKSNINSPIAIRVKVNGQWTSRRPTYVGPNQVGYDSIGVPDNVTSTTQFWLRLNFGSTAVRDIEFVTMTEFGGFRLSAGSTITVGTAPDPAYRAVVLGDSINGGEKNGTGNFGLSDNGTKGVKGTYTHISSLWAYAAQTLGYDNVINSGSGSTGFNISGDTVKYSAPNRVEQDVLAFNPHLVMIGTSFNDLRANQTAAEIQSIATNLILTIKASLPKTIVVILGNPTPPIIALIGGAGAVDPHNAALKSAAQTAGAYYLDPKAGDLYSPAGVRLKDGANMITGNENYISSDSTHPTQAGADFFGSGYIADMLRLVHPVGTPGTTTPPPPTTTNPTPDPTPNPPTTNPNLPVDSGLPLYNGPVSVGRKGPQAVGYTPGVIPRDQKADRSFYSATTDSGDIYDQMEAALAWQLDNPTKNAEVTINDGELIGKGAGSTAKVFLENIGDASLARKIRVRAAGPYGYLRLKQGTERAPMGIDNKTTGHLEATYGLRLLKVDGFAFSEIEGSNSAILLSGCRNTALEYMDNLAYWGVLGYAGVTSGNIELSNLMYRHTRIKNGDGMAFGTANGPITNATMRQLFYAPMYVGERATWVDKNNNNIIDSNESPHSDQIQEKSGGPTNSSITNWRVVDSVLYAAYNCVFQIGGTTIDMVVEGSYLLGGDDLRALRPGPTTNFSTFHDTLGEATFQIFNGSGGPGNTVKTRNTYATGPMGAAVVFSNSAADTATSLYTGVKTGWTKVTPKTLDELREEAPTPPAGTTLWAKRY